MREKTIWTDLATAVKNLPMTVLGYSVGLIIFTISDTDILSIFLLSVFSAFAFGSIFAGAAIFFGAYVLARSIGGLSDSIVHAAATIARKDRV